MIGSDILSLGLQNSEMSGTFIKGLDEVTNNSIVQGFQKKG